jgi:glycosyltransferase involved in cell wall biosynthesis
MKIGLDVAQTCVERAGCSWYADALARALVAAGRPRGHTFELYHHFGSWINADTERGTLIRADGVSSPLHGMEAAAAREVWRRVADGEPLPGRPDVVLSFGCQAPKLPHARLVYTVHDLVFWLHPEFSTEENRLLCQRELLQALARADGFLFVSEHTHREFDLLLPGWLEQTQRPHALAPGASRFDPAALPREWSADAPWLMVGSVEPRKNHAAALDAYEEYFSRSNQRRPLLIAGGRGWKSDAVHARIAALAERGLPVSYSGYASDPELAARYASSFALLAPSWHEGFGLPLVEAMTAGLPALAGLRASLPEVGGQAARYIDPDNPEGLAAAMLALEADPAGYARRSAASLTRGRQFSWAKTAKSVLEFVEQLPLHSPPA